MAEEEAELGLEEESEVETAEEEKEQSDENEQAKEETKTTPKKNEKKKSNSDLKNQSRSSKDSSERVVIMPPCRHAWCLGEELRKSGIEPGVCCPKPLPWGVPARLLYLPGWDEECKTYRCKPISFGTLSAKRNRNMDLERQKFEAAEAKLLWSYLAPIFKYPKKLEYNDEFESKPCQCALNVCHRRPQQTQQQQTQQQQAQQQQAQQQQTQQQQAQQQPKQEQPQQ